ncbi:hypothetical protein SCLCIDRAFT_21199 [Scleroderma citrinum Foug A]|uniref:Uncharacterized protein n=1 Tax=Scleroderma citrinum Foug A TaxID=1036808 RepID=A0A0C3E3F5_9AGAM|nr:hypothetical protein SCLCIDRAFT_21199 [Scleroderma citrinum Foug A]
MEPTSLLARYSAIAADHDYTLLEGQPLSQLPDTSWSIVRLERSYLVVNVSPEPTAYGPCLPCPCQVFLPILFMMLPRWRQIQHTYLAPLLADDIYEHFNAYIPSFEH